MNTKSLWREIPATKRLSVGDRVRIRCEYTEKLHDNAYLVKGFALVMMSPADLAVRVIVVQEQFEPTSRRSIPRSLVELVDERDVEPWVDFVHIDDPPPPTATPAKGPPARKPAALGWQKR